MCLFDYRMAQTTEWLPAILDYYKNNRYLPGNNRNVLEHNRKIFGGFGNSIIGKIKSIMYQCLAQWLWIRQYKARQVSLYHLVNKETLTYYAGKG